jgi:cell fate regulator YaaT (PSP1 superfamily)
MSIVIVEARDLHERIPAKSGRFDVKPGDKVLISSDNGLESAVVVDVPETYDKKRVDMEIIRHLNEDDMRVLKENEELGRKVYPDILKEVKTEKLDMKLTKVSYTYDRQKLFIYYTAEKRVDFRKFIRVLGVKLKIRVQMVQIGVRDNASIIGGIGMCGRDLCCHSFLRHIESVNIDMARNQNISLNPENISGCCGRLLCCLRYENCMYEEAKKELPQVGKKVMTPEGWGDVVKVNYIKKTAMVKLNNTGAIIEFKGSDIESGVKNKFKKWMKNDRSEDRADKKERDK